MAFLICEERLVVGYAKEFEIMGWLGWETVIKVLLWAVAADAGGRARFKGKPGEAEGKLKDGFLDVRDVAIGAALYTGVDLIESKEIKIV